MCFGNSSLCLARECDCGRDVSSRLMQRREDLRSSVVALDGSDGRAQQLDPSDAGWAGGAADRRSSFLR